jgi:hypothetical protein
MRNAARIRTEAENARFLESVTRYGMACGDRATTTSSLVNVGSVMVCRDHGRQRVTWTGEACEHPGVFSRHVPGDPSRFNETEFCGTCQADVPASEL